MAILSISLAASVFKRLALGNLFFQISYEKWLNKGIIFLGQTDERGYLDQICFICFICAEINNQSSIRARCTLDGSRPLRAAKQLR